MNEYPWLVIARQEEGQEEIPGRDANDRIVEYLESTNLGTPDNQSDETPWCSAFVNWCVIQAGFEGTNSAWARSWANWGQEADWDNLIPGAIVVLSRGVSSGHVGFFLSATETHVELLGGNQGNMVKSAWFDQDRILKIRVPV